jgi:hypothetical protein
LRGEGVAQSMNDQAPSSEADSELMLRYLDGSLSGAGMEQLTAKLRTHSELRRQFATLLLQESQLFQIGQERRSASQFSKEAAVFEPKARGHHAGERRKEIVLSFKLSHGFLALAAAIVLALAFWWSLAPSATPRLARFSLEGAVVIQRGTRSLSAERAVRIRPGDLVKTATNAVALITYPGEATRIRIMPGTRLKVINWSHGKTFEVQQGKIEATVAHQSKAHPMIWRTPEAEATVVGTGLALEVGTNTTRLEVLEGKVNLTSLQTSQCIQVQNNQYALAAPGTVLKAQPSIWGTGKILREYWLDIPGVHIGNLTHNPRYPNQPSGRDFPSQFASSTNWSANYATRFRGYIHPQTSGAYTFWIAGGECADLLLSPDENPERAVRVASFNQAVAPGEWETFPWQKSDPIKLQAGRKYYIEVLHKAEKRASDHCSVAWQVPGRKREIIFGEFLSPFKPEGEE